MVQYKKKGNYETAHLDDEWIILNTDDYTITKLNKTGGFCWDMLNEIQTVESISHEIVKSYGTKSDHVREDVEYFLLELIRCGLIEHVR